jgi:phosphodiesterase/alkaline phosphatase D-like protein
MNSSCVGLKLAFALMLATFATLPRPLQAASLVTFPQGVASGDVTPFSAVLWTRVQPTVPTSGGQEALTVEVALDSGFRRIHFRRTVNAQSNDDFTIKVVALPLLPGQLYYFRWRHISADSPIGTFRTAPAPDLSASARFTWTGDSDGTRVAGLPAWNNFEVFDAVRAEAGDFFIYLGDTIYADSAKRAAPAVTLDEYRAVYKEARGYPSLQGLLQSVSTYAIWDDHEVVDDWSGQTVDPVLYSTGRRSFNEYMPALDIDFPIAGCAGTPRFRVFRWGADINLIILDTHTCRSADARAACTYPSPPLPPGAFDLAPTLPGFIRAANPAFFPPLTLIPQCLATINDPSRTLLGPLQKQLFKDTLLTSRARFTFILSPSPIGQVYVNPYSRWEGYAAERAEIIRFIRDQQLQNVVFLSTDDHRNLVHQVFVDRLTEPSSVAREFVTGPVAYATDQALVLEFFGLDANTDCAAPENAGQPGCLAVAAEQQVMSFVAVSCRHLNQYSYGLVAVDVASGVATVTLKDDRGQVIHDQLTPTNTCTGQIGR